VFTLRKQPYFRIPAGDSARALIFGDPCYGTKKSLIINGNAYEDAEEVVIDHTGQVFCGSSVPWEAKQFFDFSDHDRIARDLVKALKLKHGSFEEEFPEQAMAVRFLTGSERILELGANVGRASCLMAHILQTKGNGTLFSLECDPAIAVQLTENRDANNLSFTIINAALSARPLVQSGWVTTVSDVVLPGSKRVNTLTYDSLLDRAQVSFDTLVVDCEGAFYHILVDMPQILKTVRLIIMENDFLIPEHKTFVDETLLQHNFTVAAARQYGNQPNFFEAWTR
jgi:FkbM family methyltransferase